MERNGSIFIKLGQHLTSLNYLLPSEWCDTFIPLQDKCPVSSFESIEDMVLQDTGRSLSEYFLSFEKEPIGAASLAQVHRAVDRETGQKVAVKVQHPTLDKWVGLDLGLTRFTFGVIKRWFPEYDLTWLSEEMEASLPKELDFNHEARNAMRIRDYFGRVRNTPVVIPRVFWAQRRILVMEYVSGHRPDDLEYLDSHGIDRDEVSAALARIFNEMIFGTGAPLHCDCHGGNLAIRHNASRRKNKFDVIIYDHGLYREPAHVAAAVVCKAVAGGARCGRAQDAHVRRRGGRHQRRRLFAVCERHHGPRLQRRQAKRGGAAQRGGERPDVQRHGHGHARAAGAAAGAGSTHHPLDPEDQRPQYVFERCGGRLRSSWLTGTRSARSQREAANAPGPCAHVLHPGTLRVEDGV